MKFVSAIVLPHSELSWVDSEELERLTKPEEILKLDDEGNYGYLFEVDLDYPRELHAATVDFPLAPERGYIEEDMFSSFMRSYYNDLCAARGCNNKYKAYQKLLLTQYDKQKYVCHYSILKFYLGMGMKLVRVHSAIRFRQKRFVELYINYNSEKRTLTSNAFLTLLLRNPLQNVTGSTFSIGNFYVLTQFLRNPGNSLIGSISMSCFLQMAKIGLFTLFIEALKYLNLNSPNSLLHANWHFLIRK